MSIENLVSDKINFGIPRLPSSEHQFHAEGFSSHPSIKRRRTEEYEDSTSYGGKVTTMVYSDTRGYPPARSFLSIRHNSCVYHAEHSDGDKLKTVMYLPLTEDIMVNMRNIEQISFESDQFFLADERGNYVGAKPGNAIHLWRFDHVNRKLFISRSIVFLKEQDYQNVHYQLETL